MTILEPDREKRKSIHQSICKRHKEWKTRITSYIILMVVAAAIVVSSIPFMLSYPLTVDGVLLIIGVDICFACIPFFVALSAKNTAKYKCAYPYSSYANGKLVLEDDELKYYFWEVGPNEPAAYSSKRAVYNVLYRTVYRIKAEDIQTLICKDNKCEIMGWGTLFDTSIRNTTRTQEFSFVLAFKEDNPDKTILNWWHKKAEELYGNKQLTN